MSEKLLTEAEWKKFAKGRDLKDSALLKAFQAYDKARTPEDQLKALPLIEKEVDQLRKAGKGDKELTAQFDAMDKALERATKEARAAEKQAQESEAEEGEEAPDLLTTKMVPLLRQVKKGEELPVMVASDGRKVAVLMSRRAISPSRRKLLSDYLDGSGALKYFLGTCLFEENAYTFVLKTQAAGLAKKIKVGLLEQVNLRLKVRVRGEEPDDVDDDGEEAPPDELEAHEDGAPAATAPPQASAAAPAETETDPLEAEYAKRWAVLEPRVLAALRDGVGETAKIRAVAEFVSSKGAAKQFKAALQGADSLEKLLQAPAPVGTPETAPQTAAAAAAPGDKLVDEGAAFNARLTALMPRIKEAMAGNAALKTHVAEAGVKARGKDFDAANALLDEIDALLQSPAPVSSTLNEGDEGGEEEGDETPHVDTAEQRRYEARLAEVEPQLLDLFAARHPESGKLRAILAYAAEQAEAGAFAKAIAALDRAVTLAQQTAPVRTDEPYPGLIAYRKSLLALRSAVDVVERQIAQLVATIPDALPDEVDLAEGLADELRESTEALHDLVDEAMSGAEDPDKQATQALREQLDVFIAEVRESELIKHVDANPFGVALTVEKTLGDALAAVRQALPTQA